MQFLISELFKHCVPKILIALSVLVATQIRDQLRDNGPDGGQAVSAQTIRNRLHAEGYYARNPVRVPGLTDAHKVNRLDFGNTYVRWNRRQWSKVGFSDESRYCVKHVDGRVKVWRRTGERYEDMCMQEVDQFGGGSVMVWGMMTTQGRSELVEVAGNLNSHRYRDEILRPHMLPYAGAMDEFILMQDNARPHTARIIYQFLEEEGIEVMDWPSKSPDLNPIEHLWDQLGKRVARRMTTRSTRADLSHFLQEEWVHIPQQNIRNLVNSMRRRCMAVSAAQGSHTRY